MCQELEYHTEENLCKTEPYHIGLEDRNDIKWIGEVNIDPQTYLTAQWISVVFFFFTKEFVVEDYRESARRSIFFELMDQESHEAI